MRHILKLALPSSSLWNDAGVGLQLLLVSFMRNRIAQLLHNLYFYFTVLVMSVRDKKQRRNKTWLMILYNILLFPWTLAMLVIASALAAPVLPLFTLPVFFFAYPRPLRFWPGTVGASANVCEDTVYYKHFSPQLAQALRTGFGLGSLGMLVLYVMAPV